MLRRRILSSAMASVMAIGSVAVVANAEETAVSAVKTKADLEAYVASLEGFCSNEINDYGSVSGEKLLNAVEYAINVIEDTESTVDDYTVAYAMIEATYNALKIYTAEELKALVDANTANIETGNVYNEELGDPIFVAENNTKGLDGKLYGYTYFESAYYEAESVLNSSDSRIITDAYEELEDQVNHLIRNPVVTKAQFRAALKAYETMLQNEFKYDSWRIGQMSGDWINMLAIDGEAGYWGYQNQKIAYGTLYDHLKSAEKEIEDQYEYMDEIKSLNKTSLPEVVKACYAAENAVMIMDAWKVDETTRGSKAAVKKLLNQYHGRLVYDYNATTDNNGALALYNAVAAMKGVKVEQANKVKGGTEYVDAYTTTVPTDVFMVSSAGVLSDADANGHGVYVDKLIDATLNIKNTGDQFYIPLNDDGYWVGAKPTTTKPDGKYKTVTKNVPVDLTEYIAVTSDDITTGADNSKYNSVLDGNDVGDPTWAAPVNCEVNHDHPGGDDLVVLDRVGKWGAVQSSGQPAGAYYISSEGTTLPTTVKLDAAMALAELYINGTKDDIKAQKGVSTTIYALDTTDSIAADSAKGSSTEWTLVYRYLQYALADKYDAETGSKTKADVEQLIDDCYDLAELTGDAALFAYRHNNLVDARQVALDWIKAANKDKKYKDGQPVDGVDANGTYWTLYGVYSALKDDYDAFKYSYEEIYLAIADAKAMIDDGELEATDSLLAAVEDVAYRLSTLPSMEDVYGIENDAFTSDFYFQGFNRVYTNGGKRTVVLGANDNVVLLSKDNCSVVKAHADLTAAYDALKAEIAAQTAPAAVKGDVNGDGVVNALDAAALLKNVVEGVTMDAAVADYNGDAAINALDAAAILTAIVNG